MKIIAVMSPKGGIGKTTTSDSIAYMLGEEQGKRVLVLDGDPQGCLLYTSPSPRDISGSRMPSSA